LSESEDDATSPALSDVEQAPKKAHAINANNNVFFIVSDPSFFLLNYLSSAGNVSTAEERVFAELSVFAEEQAPKATTLINKATTNNFFIIVSPSIKN